MKTKLIAMLMLAAGSTFAGTRVSFGLNIGAPVVPIAPAYVVPAPVAYGPVAYATPCPGPGYVWVNGGYTFVGGRRVFNAGYWRAPIIQHRIIERRGFERGFRR